MKTGIIIYSDDTETVECIQVWQFCYTKKGTEG